jgi:predicted DNA-binding WGR domain protein
VVRQFGRIGTEGRRSVRFFSSISDAQNDFDQEVARRAKRLYVLVWTLDNGRPPSLDVRV